MDNFSIERLTSAHVTQLQHISRETFSETFAHLNSEENMTAYLEQSLSIEKLFEELKNPQSQFYFAVVDGHIAGYLKINLASAQTENQTDNSLEVERIYVLKEWHGKKVGQLLFDKAMKIADELQVNYVWLGVWEHNQKAIRFYEKNGFKTFDQHVFMLGDDKQIDLMMKKPLITA